MYPQLKGLEPEEYVACDCAEKLLAQHPGRIKKVVCDLEKDRPFEESYRVLSERGQILIGHFLQKRLFMRNVWAKRFKIVQYPHTIEEIEKAAQEA